MVTDRSETVLLAACARGAPRRVIAGALAGVRSQRYLVVTGILVASAFFW
jgi:hypothetical protein